MLYILWIHYHMPYKYVICTSNHMVLENEIFNPCYMDPYIHTVNPLMLVHPIYDNDNTCSICLVSILKMHVLVNCGHRFCQRCIARWAKRRSHTCPLCRSPILRSSTTNRRPLLLQSVLRSRSIYSFVHCDWSKLGAL